MTCGRVVQLSRALPYGGVGRFSGGTAACHYARHTQALTPPISSTPHFPSLPAYNPVLRTCAAPAASNVYADYLLHMVDYEVVNKIIEEDFSHGDGTHTIYLLNPSSHVPYAYTYPNGM